MRYQRAEERYLFALETKNGFIWDKLPNLWIHPPHGFGLEKWNIWDPKSQISWRCSTKKWSNMPVTLFAVLTLLHWVSENWIVLKPWIGSYTSKCKQLLLKLEKHLWKIWDLNRFRCRALLWVVTLVLQINCSDKINPLHCIPNHNIS